MVADRKSIAIGALAGFGGMQLLLMAGAFGYIMLASYIPFVLLLLAAFNRSHSKAALGIALGAGGLMGVGLWFLLLGSILTGLIDLGIGFYWAYQITK